MEQEQWFIDHPMKEWVQSNPKLALPVCFWGDEAPIKKAGPRQCRRLHWFSPFCTLGSDRSRVLCCISDTADFTHKAENLQQFESVAWSFNICQEENVWPKADHQGIPYEPRDHRYQKAGQKLNSEGKRPIYVGMCGDWKFFVDEFGLSPNYKHNNPDLAICAICMATMKEGPLCAWNAAEDADWASTTRENAEHVSFSPLAKIKGFHIFNFYEDMMHDDLLGIRPSIVGASLVICCQHGLFDGDVPVPLGGDWKDRLQTQLNVAYRDFCKWASSNGHRHSQPTFKVCGLKLRNLSSSPYMKSKAHNCAVLSQWCKARVETIKDVDSEMQVLFMVLDGMVDIWVLAQELKAKDTIFLDPTEKARLAAARRHALEGYMFLWRFAQHNELARYGCRPKFHKLDHCLRRAIKTGLSYSCWWSFACEGAIGTTAKTCAVSHASTLGVRPTQRWLVSFMNNLGRSQDEI